MSTRPSSRKMSLTSMCRNRKKVRRTSRTKVKIIQPVLLTRKLVRIGISISISIMRRGPRIRTSRNARKTSQLVLRQRTMGQGWYQLLRAPRRRGESCRGGWTIRSMRQISILSGQHGNTVSPKRTLSLIRNKVKTRPLHAQIYRTC